MPVIFTLVIIIGFIGNLLVALVVIFDKTMRSTTNILIFNLAVMRIVIVIKYGLIQKLSDVGPAVHCPLCSLHCSRLRSHLCLAFWRPMVQSGESHHIIQ